MATEQVSADKLVDVLRRHGFVQCDIPACNCGSWHLRYGYPERFQEISDALQFADVELNGVTLLQAIKNVITERDAARREAATFRHDTSVALAALDDAKKLAMRQANEIRRLAGPREPPHCPSCDCRSGK